MNGERRCWGRVEFLRDCRSGNGRYHNVFFLPTSVVGRENQKDPFLMRRKRKECCQQEGKSALVMLNSSVSKILHEFHLESGKKDRNKEKLRVIRTPTKLILSDITSLNIDSDWYPDTSTLSDVKK